MRISVPKAITISGHNSMCRSMENPQRIMITPKKIPQ